MLDFFWFFFRSQYCTTSGTADCVLVVLYMRTRRRTCEVTLKSRTHVQAKGH